MGEPPSNGQAHTNGASTGGGGFSLKFTSKKSAPLVKGSVNGVKEDDKRELILGLTDGRVEPANPQQQVGQGGQKIIPKLANSLEIGRMRAKPERYIPEPAAVVVKEEDRFESAGPEVAQANVQYGLQKRQRPEEAAPAAQLSVTSREWETKRFKEEVEELPHEADLDAYRDMPVEDFGMALMRGMGWTEGCVAGRNPNAKVVEAVEYVARPHKLGLGARPAEPAPSDRKRIKPGDTREPKKDLVYYDEKGVQKHVKTLDAKMVEREKEGAGVGKTMRVVTGIHSGLLCQVLALEPEVEGRSQRATVRLQLSQEAVCVRVKELGEKWESPEDNSNDKSRKGDKSKKRSRDDGQRRDDNRRRDDDTRRDEQQSTKAAVDPGGRSKGDREAGSGSGSSRGKNDAQQAAAPARSWLAPHIVVRIVDRALKGGRLYLKKAEVVDVPAPGVCGLLLLDSQESVTDVQQRSLETVVPKQEGARVLILAGPHRGQRARLLQRNSAAAAAAVQLTSDLSVVKVVFEDIAEYLGEAGEEE